MAHSKEMTMAEKEKRTAAQRTTAKEIGKLQRRIKRTENTQAARRERVKKLQAKL